MKIKTLASTAVLIALLCLSVTPQVRNTAKMTPRTGLRKPAAQKSVTTASGIELVMIPGGSFIMGSDHSQEDMEEGDERPVHRVTFKHWFYMGKYEVTQAQYRAVMGKNPSANNGENLPVDSVMWPDAVEFTRRLTAKNDGFIYRLPSEAEWEYACRAGTTTDFAFGPLLSSLQANFDGTQPFGDAPKAINRSEIIRVGSFTPNAWGLYDMHGNVMEWCLDAYHYSYDGAPTDGSAWVTRGDTGMRVLRGGSFFDRANELRSPSRERLNPIICDETIGFRVVAVKK
jgi:eukaryotic-like serine/threonine-protein kinase